MKTTLRRRTRLDAMVSLVYEYRHEIAYGLMVAAVMLRSWAPIIDLAPVKTARARVVSKPQKPKRK